MTKQTIGVTQRAAWFCVALIWLAAGVRAEAPPAERMVQTARLRGGAIVTAPVLRLDGEAAIFDIGHALLRVPRSEIVEMEATADVATTAQPTAAVAAAGGIYMLGDAGAVRTTSDSVRETAPSVVLVRTPAALGSGFFVNRQGLLLTNYHVIAGQRRIAVTQFVAGEKGMRQVAHRDVEIVAVAPFYDLAVLRVKAPGTDFTPAVFPGRDDTRAGDRVFVIGNPMGLEQTVTEGVISQAHRMFGGILYRQIDAPVNPGNSGGPLFNARGQVIGVINAKIPYMDGLGFAIPLNHVLYVLDHLDAFAFNPANSESGYIYPDPPPRPRESPTSDPAQ